jgi:hypothetical protein
MKAWPQDLVATALSAPQETTHWSASQWTRLVQQGRAARLLARVAETLGRALPGQPPPWPPGVQGHFEAAQRTSQAQQDEVRREAAFIVSALSGLGAPVVVLKGAAYVLGPLPAASGRVFGDIDIMVPKAVIAQAESLLMMNGWMNTHHSDYDQRYYRQWMHELPPLQHVHRGTTLDVHHAILPETARLRPDPARLFERAIPLDGHPGLHVLAPDDMVLHSMTHLFMNDDTGSDLRDLSDLDLLLRHFGARPEFWTGLVRRARELGLGRMLHHGLRQTRRVLSTPVPDAAVGATQEHAPLPGVAALMDAIWARALRSPHPSARAPGAAAALFALFVRGHWLRMPPLMLARHLATKALLRRFVRSGDSESPAPGI